MTVSTKRPACQLDGLQTIHEPLSALGRLWQFRLRLKRFLKRRWNFIRNRVRGGAPAANPEQTATLPLQAGDWVEVRSRAEIQASLGDWNMLKGCTFMEEMWQYCGTRQQVLKRVNRFLDERDYQTKKVRGIVILANVHCQGTVDFGPCDRSCFFFWREEWLKKLEV